MYSGRGAGVLWLGCQVSFQTCPCDCTGLIFALSPLLPTTFFFLTCISLFKSFFLLISLVERNAPCMEELSSPLFSHIYSHRECDPRMEKCQVNKTGVEIKSKRLRNLISLDFDFLIGYINHTPISL